MYMSRIVFENYKDKIDEIYKESAIIILYLSICDGDLYYVPRIFRHKRTLIIIYCVSLYVAEEVESLLFSSQFAQCLFAFLSRGTQDRGRKSWGQRHCHAPRRRTI